MNIKLKMKSHWMWRAWTLVSNKVGYYNMGWSSHFYMYTDAKTFSFTCCSDVGKRGPGKKEKVNQQWHTVLELPGVSVYLMTVFPLLLYTDCHHCLQCIDFPSNRDSFYACWWQSDNLLQMLQAPLEAYLISWILLYHPSPSASLFDCLLLWPGLGGVSMWACWGLQSQGTSITEPPPSALRGG